MRISGVLPRAMGNMNDLKQFMASSTSVSGFLPKKLGHIGKLEWLSASYTPISGTLPKKLEQAGDLEHIDLHSMQLSGTLPPEWGRLKDLEKLSLHADRVPREDARPQVMRAHQGDDGRPRVEHKPLLLRRRCARDLRVLPGRVRAAPVPDLRRRLLDRTAGGRRCRHAACARAAGLLRQEGARQLHPQALQAAQRGHLHLGNRPLRPLGPQGGRPCRHRRRKVDGPRKGDRLVRPAPLRRVSGLAAAGRLGFVRTAGGWVLAPRAATYGAWWVAWWV